MRGRIGLAAASEMRLGAWPVDPGVPEGPEIRRAADEVAAAIVGEIADEVVFGLDRLRPREADLQGRRVEEVAARGKAMLTRFGGGLAVYSHNQLYGRWYVRPRGELPDTRRQLRFAVHTRDRSALLYSASEIVVLDRDAERDHPFLAELGPDPLDLEVTADEVAERLGSDRFRRRQLGAVLLDQRFVAGLGNYLRAEALFEAGVDPRRRAADLGAAAVAAVADRVVGLPRRSYRTGGVTLPDEVAADLRGCGVPRSRRRFWVFGREGEPCRRCRTAVERIPVGGRAAFFCPRCQG